MPVFTRGEYTISPLADGATGAAGRSVAAIVEEYYLSTSKTAQTGGSWVTAPPAWSSGKYMWTRSKITYSNPAGTEYTTPIVSSEWEAVNEVQVGGRNLYAIQTNSELGGLNSININAASNIRLRFISAVEVEGGKQYTITPYKCGNFIGVRCGIHTIKNDGTPVADPGWINLTFGEGYVYTMPAEAQKCRIVFSFSSSNTVVTTGGTETTTPLSLDDVRAYRIKLEKGNKATDWTPAPEDVQGQIDGLSSGLAGANTAINQIISANTAERAAIDARIVNLNSALSGLSTNVDGSNNSTQESIDTIQAMIASLEAQREVLASKITLLEQSKVKTDNYIQVGNVKLSNGETVFGVAIGKDVDVLNADGTISTFERSMTATTSNSFLILTGGTVVGIFDPTGMTAESVKVNSIIMGGRFAWRMTPSNAMVLKKGV